MTFGILEMVGIISLVFLGIIIIPLVIGLLFIELKDMAEYWFGVGKNIRKYFMKGK